MKAYLCELNDKSGIRFLTGADSEEEAHEQATHALNGIHFRTRGASIEVSRAEGYDDFILAQPKRRQRYCFTGNGYCF